MLEQSGFRGVGAHSKLFQTTGKDPWQETQGGKFKFNTQRNLRATQWEWVTSLGNELYIIGHIELEAAGVPVRGGTDGIPQPPKLFLTAFGWMDQHCPISLWMEAQLLK